MAEDLRVFLETYPLYKKCTTDGVLHGVMLTDLQERFPAITAKCSTCNTPQTFRLLHSLEYLEFHDVTGCPRQVGYLYAESGVTLLAGYRCTSCDNEYRVFTLRLLGESKVMKVGQYPPWSIEIPKPVDKALGSFKDRYKNGLICESQSFGIGAFGYYRSIVEGIIDELLDSVLEVIPEGEEQNKYTEALEKTKLSRVTQEKIDLVKDLLPDSLKPEGMNPLGVMHHALSEGLHALDDEQCLTMAEELRTALEFFISQIDLVRSSSKQFTDSMRKLLEKKGGGSS